EEAARARVRLVAELHGGALLLRERGRAAVREQVDEDIFGAEQEGVEARLLDRGAAPLSARQGDRLDDLDPPGRNARRAHHELRRPRAAAAGSARRTGGEAPGARAARSRSGSARARGAARRVNGASTRRARSAAGRPGAPAPGARRPPGAGPRRGGPPRPARASATTRRQTAS